MLAMSRAPLESARREPPRAPFDPTSTEHEARRAIPPDEPSPHREVTWIRPGRPLVARQRRRQYDRDVSDARPLAGALAHGGSRVRKPLSDDHLAPTR